MDRAGLVGDDGPTHHGVFDIAYLRCLPNMTLMAPRDEAMLVAHAAHGAALTTARSACATRAARASASPLPADAAADRGRHRRDPARGRPRRAARLRHAACRRRSRPPTCSPGRAIEATVADARFAKPLDGALLAQLCSEHELLVTIEEGVLQGGFGSAVWEHLSDAGIAAPRIMRVGLPDRYVTHGKPALLHTEVGFTGRAIARRVCAALGVGDEVGAEA